VNSPSQRLVRLGRPRKETTEQGTDNPTTGASGGPVKTVYVETYGCQMNVADSELMSGVLRANGYGTAHSAKEADVIIVNTCAVRERAEERVVARTRELSVHKKTPEVTMALIGCMAEHLKAKLFDRAPWIDVIAGPDTYRRLPALLEESATGGKPVVDIQLDKEETYEGLTSYRKGDGVSGFVTIQRGCDKFCTFCVVPFTRGRERGVAPREVLRQVRQLVSTGHKEVTLLGQTVNSYRYEDVSFAELLSMVARIDGIERVRFTSPYPVDFTDDVIDVIRGNDKVCNYLHLPLQSGSDAVLARMKRGYTVGEFRALTEKLRAKVPNIALSTDILSGFSGETEADHHATLDVMKEIRFDSAFMFSYSERSLTQAAKKLPDDVTSAVKKVRLQQIIAAQETISREVFAGHVGREERVLLHSTSKRSEDQLVGRTDGFKSVIIPRGAHHPGQTVSVTIEGATQATLFGSVLQP